MMSSTEKGRPKAALNSPDSVTNGTALRDARLAAAAFPELTLLERKHLHADLQAQGLVPSTVDPDRLPPMDRGTYSSVSPAGIGCQATETTTQQELDGLREHYGRYWEARRTAARIALGVTCGSLVRRAAPLAHEIGKLIEGFGMEAVRALYQDERGESARRDGVGLPRQDGPLTRLLTEYRKEKRRDGEINTAIRFERIALLAQDGASPAKPVSKRELLRLRVLIEYEHDPEASGAEISRRTGVPERTVRRILAVR
jgi:hypothetical protein